MLRRYGVLAAIFLLVLGGTWGVHAWRYRHVVSNQDLLRFLPAESGSTLFVDVRLLRQSGVLEQTFAPKSVAQDPDYLEFVRETKFDYARDLEILAATNIPTPVVVARGHFDWSRLRDYARHHGGSCSGDICHVAPGASGRRILFREIQPDVLQLSTGTLPEETRRPERRMPSSEPVWLELGSKALADPAELPLPMRIFAISMAQASPILFSLGAAAEGSGAAFVLRLKAQLPNAATADTVRKQLELQTQMLDLELKREKQLPDPANLTGLLIGGSFENQGTTVLGTWPVRRELLQALQ